jgi:hypothetical protein
MRLMLAVPLRGHRDTNVVFKVSEKQKQAANIYTILVGSNFLQYTECNRMSAK